MASWATLPPFRANALGDRWLLAITGEARFYATFDPHKEKLRALQGKAEPEPPVHHVLPSVARTKDGSTVDRTRSDDNLGLSRERATNVLHLLRHILGLPSRERVIEQLDNHRKRLEFFGTPDAAKAIQAEIASAEKSEIDNLEIDLKMTEVDKHGKRINEATRLSILKLISKKSEAAE